jgi:hypothetical protein
MTALTRRLTQLEAKVGGDRARPALIMFRQVIDTIGDPGELHSAMVVGGGRCQREASESEAEFEARALALAPATSRAL